MDEHHTRTGSRRVPLAAGEDWMLRRKTALDGEHRAAACLRTPAALILVRKNIGWLWLGWSE